MSRNFEILQRLEQQQPATSALGQRNTTAATVEKGPIALHDMSLAGIRPSTTISDQVRDQLVKLVHALFLLNVSNEIRIVVFSSVDEDANTGLLAASAADVLAEHTGRSACVVDANFRQPSLHSDLLLGNVQGFTTALLESAAMAEVAQRVADQLWAVTAGPPVEDCEALPLAPRMSQCMAELRSCFDFVLVAAPPLCLAHDAAALGQFADGAVIVITANSTRRERAQKAKEILESAHVRLLGAVLNNRTLPVPERIYSHI